MVHVGDESTPCANKVTDIFIDQPEPIIKPKKKQGLPCPEPVAETPLSNPAPSSVDVWKLRGSRAQGFAWNLTRHFILGGVGTGITVLISTRSLSLAGFGFVAGGLASAVRKGGDDKRRAAGKPDLLTAVKDRITRTEGNGMGIRDEVYEVKAELVKVGDILTDDVPNSQQLTEGMAAVLGVIKEGSDFKDIPQQERAKAIGHAFIMAGAEIYDKAVQYSDEA